jgi:hypothetical protein
MNSEMGSSPILRVLVAALGAGTVAFGIAPILAPRTFAAMFGLPHRGEPAADVPIRSVSVRDLVNGIGLLATLNNPNGSLPWLALRFASDTGDAIACWAAAAHEPRNRRLKMLGVLACGAALLDASLLAWTQIQRTASTSEAVLCAKREGS